jgi:hypothetical protein
VFVFQFKATILVKNTNLRNTFEEKRSLLLEMIAFATIDGSCINLKQKLTSTKLFFNFQRLERSELAKQNSGGGQAQ